MNLKSNAREWQILCDYLASLYAVLALHTRFLKIRPFYDAVQLWHTNVFPDFSSISGIIVENQAFSGLCQSLHCESEVKCVNGKLFAIN